MGRQSNITTTCIVWWALAVVWGDMPQGASQ